jgi:tRNA (guanine26-N2/guanine27-N2)-dimethyltransferase
MWLGKIQDAEVIHRARTELVSSARAGKLLQNCECEVDAPMYYDHHSICERLNITPGKVDEVIEALTMSGYKASRTHFCGLAIKTDAPLCSVEEAVKTA